MSKLPPGRRLSTAILFVLVFCLASAARGNLILDISSTALKGKPGDTVIVEGTITNTTGGPLQATDMFLNFDAFDPSIFDGFLQLLGTPDFALPNNTQSPLLHLFSFTLDAVVKPGIYSFEVLLQDVNNNTSPAVNLNVQVQSSIAVPDGEMTLPLLAAGLVALRVSRHKWK